MARFDVHPVTGDSVSLVVDVQADMLNDLPSRIVVPLIMVTRLERPILARLEPIITIDGHRHVLATAALGVISARALQAPVANVEARHRDDIVSALDFLFQGY